LGLVPFCGSVTVGGHDVVRAPVAARTRVGYLPQRPAFGEATAEELLRFVARLRRLPGARVAAVLDEVGLAAHARERARTFSGGMQQRLSLAAALLTDAPLMLLDEPTASLDAGGQSSFVDIVARLRKKERTLILSSHRSYEIHALTDRVLELDAGRLVQPPADDARLARIVPIGGAR
jgi:ABC-type multidrug transport system ATPase subunit